MRVAVMCVCTAILTYSAVFTVMHADAFQSEWGHHFSTALQHR